MVETDIIPGVMEVKWADVEARIQTAAEAARSVHVYFSDGTIGTAETFSDPEPFANLLARYPSVTFEAHILAAIPEKFIRPLADSGFRRITAHVESNDPRRFLEEAKYDDVEVGLAIDGATEIDQIEPFLEEIDYAVVMTAEAGVTGGTFLPESVEKIKLIRQNFPDLPIEAVGGITDRSVRAVKDAGATRIVSSEFLFSDPDGVAAAIERLDQA